ncbi:hypothetical protein AB1N83_003248 [Pleurotus pulmonarius]
MVSDPQAESQQPWGLKCRDPAQRTGIDAESEGIYRYCCSQFTSWLQRQARKVSPGFPAPSTGCPELALAESCGFLLGINHRRKTDGYASKNDYARVLIRTLWNDIPTRHVVPTAAEFAPQTPDNRGMTR